MHIQMENVHAIIIMLFYKYVEPDDFSYRCLSFVDVEKCQAGAVWSSSQRSCHLDRKAYAVQHIHSG